MNKIDKIMAAAITSVLTLTAGTAMTTAAFAAQNTSTPTPTMEKCYGIAKAHMNDCKTDNASCASSSLKDNQPDAFLFLPEGLCNKIVGGKLKPQSK